MALQKNSLIDTADTADRKLHINYRNIWKTRLSLTFLKSWFYFYFHFCLEYSNLVSLIYSSIIILL